MKKNLLKRIGAVALAVAVSLTMGVSAYAVDTPTSGGTADVAPAKHLSSNSFTIEKDIVLFNVDGSKIYEPNVTYSYSIAPTTVSSGTTVTGLIDKTGATTTTTVSVKSGVADGVKITGNGSGATAGSTATLTFGTGTTKEDTIKENATVSTSSAHVDENLTITIYPATIYNSGANSAGIYRYTLKDTTSADTLTQAGITRNSNYVDTLYLDVYLKNNSSNNGLEVYGYVLHKAGASASFNYDADSDENNKRSGFDLESETTGKYDDGTIISDQYHTYNVEVTKTTAGALADKTNNFPFKVDLSNSTIKSKADFYYVATTDGSAGTATDGALDTNGAWSVGALATTSAIAFQDGDGILITGLPTGTSVMAAEYNNTNDTYTASAKDTDNADMTLKVGSNTGTSLEVAHAANAALNAVFAVDNTSAKDVVAFTNTLDQISPTNVVMRFAPYLFILGAAIVLLVLMRRRRASQDAE